MGDRSVKQSTGKAGVSAADMAARPFQCEWHQGCSKSFNRKSDLQRHYRIHTNERPYACDYKPCNKTFIQRSALTVHRRTHTGDKPHKCPFINCGKCFSDSSSLARHRRIHTNDKPYICRNQHCKKAFCRKTTMTKHVRKEHPAEPIQDDQDAEYSDVEASDDELEDESDEIKEEPQSLYEMPVDTKKMHLGRPPSEYSRNLWGLPSQPAHRPSPLHLQGSTIPRSDSVQKIKLERVSSAMSQRSLSDPYPDTHMQSSEFSLSRADTMPNNVAIPTSVPQPQVNTSMPQQYQLRNQESMSLWSPQHAIQDSPTSLSHSSPSSASSQSHPMFTSQPYQLQSVDIASHEQMQYPHQQDMLVSSTIQQPLDEMTVHEIHLDQPQPQVHRDMASTPVHQNPFDGGIQHYISQSDPYVAMSREVSQFHDDVPPTPASTQQLPHYTTSLAEEPYQEPQYVGIGSFSTSNQVFPPNGGTFQYNDAMRSDWWKDDKLAANGFLLPAQRIQEYSWGV